MKENDQFLAILSYFLHYQNSQVIEEEIPSGNRLPGYKLSVAKNSAVGAGDAKILLNKND